MQVNQQFLEEFASRKDVTGEVLRVFLYLNARLDFENIIQVPQTEIAERLGLQPQNVHRAIKQLEALGVIIRGPKVGRSSSWRLNPPSRLERQGHSSGSPAPAARSHQLVVGPNSEKSRIGQPTRAQRPRRPNLALRSRRSPRAVESCGRK